MTAKTEDDYYALAEERGFEWLVFLRRGLTIFDSSLEMLYNIKVTTESSHLLRILSTHLNYFKIVDPFEDTERPTLKKPVVLTGFLLLWLAHWLAYFVLDCHLLTSVVS